MIAASETVCWLFTKVLWLWLVTILLLSTISNGGLPESHQTTTSILITLPGSKSPHSLSGKTFKLIIPQVNLASYEKEILRKGQRKNVIRSLKREKIVFELWVKLVERRAV